MARPQAAIGQTFGNKDEYFELNRQLDKGSQGTVYVCTQRRTGQLFAVKRIDVASLQLRRNSGAVRKNLTREIKIMESLHNERIVNLVAAFWDDDLCFIVMDLAEGGTIHDRLVPGIGLGDESACIYVTKQLLEGMGYMHSKKIIHRDLKPANILITTENPSPRRGYYDIKIADFGLSRILKEPGGLDPGMSKVGTPAFAAPEIFEDTYDEKADFWSLGCILFVMFCGEYPFSELPEHVKQPKKGKTEILPCGSFDKVSKNGQDFCLKLLDPDPNTRLDLRGCYSHPEMLLSDSECKVASRNGSKTRCEAPEAAVQLVPNLSPEASALTPAPETGGCGQAILLFMGLGGILGAKPIPEYQVPVENGVVTHVTGWSGSSCDSIRLTLIGGERRQYGGEGGKDIKEWELAEDELIIAVTQERQGDGFLGYAFVFFTSLGRTLAVKGFLAAQKKRFIAPTGTQIVGLMFEDSALTGTMIEKTKQRTKTGLVKRITGYMGQSITCIKLTLGDGEVRSYGVQEDGDSERSWDLEEDEEILIVEQGFKDHNLGYSMSFYTSMGNVYTMRGISATLSVRFMTKKEQIYGLEFDRGGKLTVVITCNLEGDTELSTRRRLLTECTASAPSLLLRTGTSDVSRRPSAVATHSSSTKVLPKNKR